MIIDTHAHYDDKQFASDFEQLLQEMRSNGVEKIIYATGKEALPERSICYIAYCLKNDINAYESYLDDQKAIIDYYYNLYVNFKDPYGEDIFN